jgi:hypothetical protein
VIDLTGDNDSEMTRALRASLEDSGLVNQGANPSSSQNFRPSDRVSDPNWALVPSNVSANVAVYFWLLACAITVE